jgi:hypothetical protein
MNDVDDAWRAASFVQHLHEQKSCSGISLRWFDDRCVAASDGDWEPLKEEELKAVSDRKTSDTYIQSGIIAGKLKGVMPAVTPMSE